MSTKIQYVVSLEKTYDTEEEARQVAEKFGTAHLYEEAVSTRPDGTVNRKVMMAQRFYNGKWQNPVFP